MPEHEPGPDCPNPEHHAHGARPRTSELLHDFAKAGESDKLELGELVDHFGARAFGVLMIVAVLPSLIPTPVGAGGLSGTPRCGQVCSADTSASWTTSSARSRCRGPTAVATSETSRPACWRNR